MACDTSRRYVSVIPESQYTHQLKSLFERIPGLVNTGHGRECMNTGIPATDAAVQAHPPTYRRNYRSGGHPRHALASAFHWSAVPFSLPTYRQGSRVRSRSAATTGRATGPIQCLTCTTNHRHVSLAMGLQVQRGPVLLIMAMLVSSRTISAGIRCLTYDFDHCWRNQASRRDGLRTNLGLQGYLYLPQ